MQIGIFIFFLKHLLKIKLFRQSAKIANTYKIGIIIICVKNTTHSTRLDDIK